MAAELVQNLWGVIVRPKDDVLELRWLPSTATMSDGGFATMKAVGAEMYRFPMGWNWYILNFYVPMIVVGHVMIIRYLLRRGGSPRARVTAT